MRCKAVFLPRPYGAKAHDRFALNRDSSEIITVGNLLMAIGTFVRMIWTYSKLEGASLLVKGRDRSKYDDVTSGWHSIP